MKLLQSIDSIFLQAMKRFSVARQKNAVLEIIIFCVVESTEIKLQDLKYGT